MGRKEKRLSVCLAEIARLSRFRWASVEWPLSVSTSDCQRPNRTRERADWLPGPCLSGNADGLPGRPSHRKSQGIAPACRRCARCPRVDVTLGDPLASPARDSWSGGRSTKACLDLDLDLEPRPLSSTASHRAAFPAAVHFCTVYGVRSPTTEYSVHSTQYKVTPRLPRPLATHLCPVWLVLTFLGAEEMSNAANNGTGVRGTVWVACCDISAPPIGLPISAGDRRCSRRERPSAVCFLASEGARDKESRQCRPDSRFASPAARLPRRVTTP